MSLFEINTVVLVGRLTKDPELRSLPSGVSLCRLRVACNSTRREAEGDYQERPNFFDVSVFGPHAESVNAYTRKGRRVGIDGRLEWHEWQTADHQTRESVSIVANCVLFLENPADHGSAEPTGPGSLDETDQDFDHEIDQTPLSELPLRPARELVAVAAAPEADDMLF
jgi:single-strand DNA-binding protein